MMSLYSGAPRSIAVDPSTAYERSQKTGKHLHTCGDLGYHCQPRELLQWQHIASQILVAGRAEHTRPRLGRHL